MFGFHHGPDYESKYKDLRSKQESFYRGMKKIREKVREARKKGVTIETDHILNTLIWCHPRHSIADDPSGRLGKKAEQIDRKIRQKEQDRRTREIVREEMEREGDEG